MDFTHEIHDAYDVRTWNLVSNLGGNTITLGRLMELLQGDLDQIDPNASAALDEELAFWTAHDLSDLGLQALSQSELTRFFFLCLDRAEASLRERIAYQITHTWTMKSKPNLPPLGQRQALFTKLLTSTGSLQTTTGFDQGTFATVFLDPLTTEFMPDLIAAREQFAYPPDRDNLFAALQNGAQPIGLVTSRVSDMEGTRGRFDSLETWSSWLARTWTEWNGNLAVIPHPYKG